MKKIQLPNGRVTTNLGFGCGPLHGGLEARQSRNVIDVAFEAGFRHFDVAPLYGLGLAEGLLGQALRGRRTDVTLATKAGLAPPRYGALIAAARSVAKTVLSPLVAPRARGAAGEAGPVGRFHVEFVASSLAQSLHYLRTHHIDIFLMHEMRVGDVTPQLLGMLQARKDTGVVGALGTGTSREAALAISAASPILAEVEQYHWSVREPRLTAPRGSLTITHGSIQPALAHLVQILATEPDVCSAWSSSLDADLARPETLSDILLGAAIAENPSGIVLVHSKNPSRIRRFVEVASDDKLLARGARLTDLVADRQLTRQKQSCPFD